jgi:hypothetical protein
MGMEDKFSGEQGDLPSWPVLATVVSHSDPAFMGTLEVSLQRPGAGNTKSAVQTQQVNMMSPFFGSTGYDYTVEDPDNYTSTQKSYGMWFVPPDPGTTVLVVFINGDPAKGYWLGCVPDEHMNFSVPGLAATEANTLPPDAEYKDGPTRLPVAEFNKRIKEKLNPSNPTKNKKPVAKFFADALEEQGLLKDDTRGITSSSARREAPSTVFGISTPGPLDKNGPKDLVGKEESEGLTFVSRLGGTTFVMDDGDAAFQRMKKPSEGPPEYASVENKEKGLVDAPHNELVRIRTRTGHQILLHNSEDLIYIGNARGTAWIELSSDGKIDIFAEDSISVHTKNDFNLYSDRDVNIEAGRNLNIKVSKEMHTEVLIDNLLIVGHDQKVHVKNGFSEKIEGDLRSDILGNLTTKVIGNIVSSSTGKTSIKATSDLSLQTDANFNLSVNNSLSVLSKGNSNFTANGNMLLSATVHHVNASSSIKLTAAGGGGRIDLNSSSNPASQAEIPSSTIDPISEPPASALPLSLSLISLYDEAGQSFSPSIVPRIPTHEPWPHHENLDPVNYKPAKTDRDANSRYSGSSTATLPEYWKKYSTNTDTFDPPPQEN